MTNMIRNKSNPSQGNHLTPSGMEVAQSMRMAMQRMQGNLWMPTCPFCGAWGNQIRRWNHELLTASSAFDAGGWPTSTGVSEYQCQQCLLRFHG